MLLCLQIRRVPVLRNWVQIAWEDFPASAFDIPLSGHLFFIFARYILHLLLQAELYEYISYSHQ